MTLGERVLKCHCWRWMRGMRTLQGLRIVRVDDDGYVLGWHERQEYLMEPVSDSVPDLLDPATRGCLLALVREAWGEPLMSPAGYVDQLGPRWRVDADLLGVGDVYDCSSEIEALVEALEQAGRGER